MNFHNVTDAMMKKGLAIDAGLQAEVWAGQLKGKRKDTKAKILLSKLSNKYPELTSSDIRFLAVRYI